MTDTIQLSADELEFNAAFADASKALASTSDAAVTPIEDDEPSDAAAESNEGQAAQAAAAPAPTQAEQPRVEKPAAQQPAADQKATKPQPAAKAAGTDHEAVIAELRADIQRVRHEERSASNRISAFAKENQRLKDEIAQLRAGTKPAQAVQRDPDLLDQTPELQAAVERRVSERTQALSSELAVIREQLQQVGVRTESMAPVIESVAQRDAQARVEQCWAALDQAYGGSWRDAVKRPEFDAYLAAAPQAVRDLFASSSDPDELRFVLDPFYARFGGQQQPTQPQAQGAQPAAAATRQNAPAASAHAQTLRDRLRNAAGISSASAAAAPAEDDFEGNFAAAAREIAQRAAMSR